MLLGLLWTWYGTFLGAETHAVVPYSQHLERFPAYLQQLDMESLGKSVDQRGYLGAVPDGRRRQGDARDERAARVYFQLLHQGTKLVPVDLIGVGRPRATTSVSTQDLLIANLLAQAEALAFGRMAAEVEADGVPPEQVPHRTFPGNRPTTTPRERAHPVGARPAHRAVRAQGLRAGRDLGRGPVRPMGVELGKTLAGRIAPELTAGTAGGSSTTPRRTR